MATLTTVRDKVEIHHSRPVLYYTTSTRLNRNKDGISWIQETWTCFASTPNTASDPASAEVSHANGHPKMWDDDTKRRFAALLVNVEDKLDELGIDFEVVAQSQQLTSRVADAASDDLHWIAQSLLTDTVDSAGIRAVGKIGETFRTQEVENPFWSDHPTSYIDLQRHHSKALSTIERDGMSLFSEDLVFYPTDLLRFLSVAAHCEVVPDEAREQHLDVVFDFDNGGETVGADGTVKMAEYLTCYQQSFQKAIDACPEDQDNLRYPRLIEIQSLQTQLHSLTPTGFHSLVTLWSEITRQHSFTSQEFSEMVYEGVEEWPNYEQVSEEAMGSLKRYTLAKHVKEVYTAQMERSIFAELWAPMVARAIDEVLSSKGLAKGVDVDVRYVKASSLDCSSNGGNNRTDMDWISNDEFGALFGHSEDAIRIEGENMVDIACSEGNRVMNSTLTGYMSELERMRAD